MANFALLAGFFCIGATIRIVREMLCLPYAGFLYYAMLWLALRNIRLVRHVIFKPSSAYPISCKCHLQNKYIISDEHARMVNKNKIFFFSKNMRTDRSKTHSRKIQKHLSSLPIWQTSSKHLQSRIVQSLSPIMFYCHLPCWPIREHWRPYSGFEI